MDITDKGLEGSLKIDGFSNLEKINCSSNELVNLEVINLKSSKEINCSNNKLAGLKVNGLDNLEVLNCSENCLTDVETLLSDLSHEKLKTLNLSNNNFSKNDLSPFSKFTNLENLYLSTTDKKGIEQGSYNKFFGSLESLKNLTKLKKLDIVNTDINSGVEPEAKVNEIKKELDNQLTKIWLDKNYPKEKRKETKELSAGFKRLRGELDLSGFENLEALDCHDNELTGLNLSKCNNLQSLKVNRNKLSDINFLNQIRSPEKLKVLHLGDNRIFSDLSPFSRFINLEDLGLGSDERFSDKEDLNNFFGSLVPLKNLTNLEVLNISDTDISDDNLENLPDNLIRIYCSSEEKTESKVKKLEDLLKKSDNFILSSKPDDFSLWDKTEVKEINLSSLEDIECQQESGLSIENFPNLKEIKYNIGNFEENREVIISNCQELKELDCSNSQLTSLNLEDCSQLTKLNCSNNSLKELNVQPFPNLKELNCSKNDLAGLELSENLQLEQLNITDRNSDIKELHKLYEEHNNNKYSGIGNHYFRFAQIFSRKFTKLDNEIKRREQGKYNKFNGSLEFLKNMSKLKTLDISNTDINEGVKYLPDSVSEIYYSFKDIPESKVKEIAEELKCREEKKIRDKQNEETNKEDSQQENERKDDSSTSKKTDDYSTHVAKSQKLTSTKNEDSDFVDYLKVSVEKDVVDEGITDRELNQALIDNNIREKTILTTIKGLKEMKNKDKEIESLKSRIKELVKLVEQQKKKVVEIFLKISPERELLQGLISKYLEFIRFKKQGSEVSDYDEQCNNYEIEY
ncbi:18483_t:CDS:2 [Racocetra persica]|uniref:18483_t:CDS:1 n=1 Tax=Racocetra persica TaxID=160502 RepID=A0ACA9M1C8_9GLOM|nr:18483_t:CDS:2 [Racocetra persica]